MTAIGIGIGIPFSNGPGEAPNLFDPGGTPSIQNSSTSGTYSDSVFGNTLGAGSATSYPRFLFNLGLTAAQEYYVHMVVTGDTSALRNAGGSTDGTRVSAVAGVIEGTFTASNNAFYITTNGETPFEFTATTLIVREA